MTLRAEDAATLQAEFEGVAEVRRLSDLEWGVGRLPLLVSDEMRAKFRRQEALWSKALQEAWNAGRLTGSELNLVLGHGAALKRAYGALSAFAVEAGHRALKPWVWETLLEDGTVAAFVQTDAEAGAVIAEGRHVQVYTLAEVAHVIDALPKALQLAKQEWPGAKVTGPYKADRSWVKAGDEIPF